MRRTALSTIAERPWAQTHIAPGGPIWPGSRRTYAFVGMSAKGRGAFVGRAVLGCALAFVAVTACGAEQPAGSFLSQLVELHCEQSVRCYFFPDMATCTVGECGGWGELGPLLRREYPDGTDFDPDAAERCLAAVAALECGVSATDVLACNQVFQAAGTSPGAKLGEPCSLTVPCQALPGMVCDASTSTCAATPPAGSPCVNAECAAGASCDPETGMCVAMAAQGQACAPDGGLPRCISSLLLCDPAPATCRLLPGAGESCTGACRGSLFCEDGICLWPGDEGDSCQLEISHPPQPPPPPTLGCLPGFSCQGYHCRAQPQTACEGHH